MNRWQRAAAMVGVVLVLFAVGRVLTPFSTRVVLNPQALRAVTRVEPCGMALSEATKAPSVRTDEIVLTALGRQAKASSQIAHDAAFAALPTRTESNGLTYTDRSHAASIPQVLPDSAYDHVTVTTFSLSPCESAARRRVTSAGVLVGLAAVGVIAALLLLSGPRRSDDGVPVP